MVRPLVAVMSTAKRRVFYDEIIEPGQQWSKEIETALTGSDAIAVMWCCDSAASDWVKREIELAALHGKMLIPIRLCPYPLRIGLDSFQAIDLSANVLHDCSCTDAQAAAEARAALDRLAKAAAEAFARGAVGAKADFRRLNDFSPVEADECDAAPIFDRPSFFARLVTRVRHWRRRRRERREAAKRRRTQETISLIWKALH